MIRRRIKIIVSLIMVLLLSACGTEGYGTAEKTDSVTGQETQQQWQDIHTSLDYQYEDVVVKDQVLYGCYADNDGAVIISQNIESGEIINEVRLPNVTDVKGIAADLQDNIYVAAGNSFWKVSNTGDAKAFDDFVLEEQEKAQNIMPKGIYIDDKGYFYFHYEMGLPLSEFYEDAEANIYTMADRIYVKNSRLETEFYEQIPHSQETQLVSFSLNEEDKPMILAKDSEGFYMGELDPEKQKLTSRKELDGVEELEITQICFTEGGFLFCSGNDLYRYHYKKDTAEKILNLLSCGIFAENILYLGIKDGVIEIVDNYDTASTSEYVRIAEGENTQNTITLGVIQLTNELEDAVVSYNRFSRETKVKLIEYCKDGLFEDGLEQLKLDIISGNAPDLIEVSVINTDVFSNKEAFADLYDFMDADASFDREMLLESVREAYESDDHLYSMGAAFQLHTIWGADSLINGKQGVSMTELIQMLESRGKNVNAIYGFSADEPVLTTLCAFAMDDFIDWNTAECNFSDQYMKDIMDFAKEYTGCYDGSSIQGIAKGEILLSIGQIGSVADYQIQKEIYGEEIAFIGYPTMEGSGTCISIRDGELAINAKSDKQDQAWDFIKYYIQNGYSGLGFPTYKDNFDAAMKEAMTDTVAESMEGTIIVPKQIYTEQEYFIEIFAASQQDVDTVIALIEEATTRHEYQADIQNIINEEAESYFQGQKDYQTVAAIIWNRINLYLSEQVK